MLISRLRWPTILVCRGLRGFSRCRVFSAKTWKVFEKVGGSVHYILQGDRERERCSWDGLRAISMGDIYNNLIFKHVSLIKPLFILLFSALWHWVLGLWKITFPLYQLTSSVSREIWRERDSGSRKKREGTFFFPFITVSVSTAQARALYLGNSSWFQGFWHSARASLSSVRGIQ